MNWKAWLHSIIAAAIGGAATSLSAILIAPASFNFSHTGLINLGQVALAGAVIPVLALLKQSPLPADSQTVTSTTSVTNSTQKLGAWMLVALLLQLAFVQGCTPAEIQETESIVNVVATAASNLVAVAVPGAQWAALLPPAIKGLETAESNFTAGTSAAADVSNAALAVEDIISGVDPNSETSELADLLTTALDSLLLVLPPATTTATVRTQRPWEQLAVMGWPDTWSARQQAQLLRVAQETSRGARYNHHGRAKIGHVIFRSKAGDFKAAWNSAVDRAAKKNPALAKAKL